MNDNNVIIATCLNSHVRVHIANTKEMVEEARRLHNLYPTSLAALGRTLSITSLMAIDLKGEDESLSCTFNGKGPIGSVMAVGKSNGEVKGFVSNPEIYDKYDNGKLAVGRAIGTDGYLKVIKNLKMRNNYTSQVQIQTGEVGDDFAYYFNVSEQKKTIVSVGVLVDKDYTTKVAGCLLIELMPDYTEEDVVYLENLLKTLKPITTVLSEDPDLLKYLKSLFPDVEVLEERRVYYHCDCSRERFLRNILALPKKDVLEIIDGKHIEIKCEFCDKNYVFNEEDTKLLEKYVQYR